MNHQLSHIKLLAFVSVFKRYRRNSILYSWEKNYKLVQKLGMSEVTIGKYILECERLGIIVPYNKERKFIKLTDIIKILFPDYTFKAFRHIRFLAGEVTGNFKANYERLKYSFAAANFQRQQYNIDRKSSIDELGMNRPTKKTLKPLKSLAKEYGCSIGDLQSVCKRVKRVVTGKYHLAKIIGCSPSTAAKLLRNWHNIGVIDRKVIRLKISSPVNHTVFDALRSSGARYIQVARDGSGFINTLGSSIQFSSSYCKCI